METQTSEDRVHFIGIGGSGMSSIARILARQGVTVTGSDAKESAAMQSMRREEGIVAHVGHAAPHVVGAQLVVVTAAVRSTNPEVIAARDAGIPVISRAEMLGRVMDKYQHSVAISGTHGKTTTTGMTACVLEEAGLDPTVLIGGEMSRYEGNARLGEGPYLVAEACEAFDSFLDLNPSVAVVTNIEADHLDYYGDLDNVLRSFQRFLSQVSDTAVICGDDLNLCGIVQSMPDPPKILSYGSRPCNLLRPVDVQSEGMQTSYTAVHDGVALGRVSLSVPGAHNISNSLGALGVGLILGIPFPKIARGLNLFTGTGRRFEKVGETRSGVLIIDDYAHHPTEIRATLAAARQACPERRIVAVFQPHLPSRTRDFKIQFAESFADADMVVLTDIFLAREQPIDGVTGAGLAALTADRRGASRVVYVSDKEMLPDRLRDLVEPGDLLLTLGAGDIRAAGEGYLADEMGSREKMVA